MEETRRDTIIGKVLSVSKKRSFTHTPVWSSEPQERSIINLYLETYEPKLGILIPKQEQAVLFGRVADEAEDILKGKEGAYVLLEDCQKGYDHKAKTTYRSWSASNLMFLKKNEFETVKKNLLKVA
jgi:hypothetical protein